jgi:hypothetical protein
MYILCIFFYTKLLIPLSPVKNKRTKLDRGQVLAAAVEATGLNKEDVANRAGYTRSAYYKHIENPNLDYHILMAYGRAIGKDFTEEFPDMPKYVLAESDEIYGTPNTLEEAIKLLELWKGKYVEILEKYNKLIEEKLSLGK